MGLFLIVPKAYDGEGGCEGQEGFTNRPLSLLQISGFKLKLSQYLPCTNANTPFLEIREMFRLKKIILFTPLLFKVGTETLGHYFLHFIEQVIIRTK